MQASPLVCRAGVSAEAENRDGGKGGRITAAEQQTGLMEDNEKREMNETVFMTCYCVCFTACLEERERDQRNFKIYIQIKFPYASSLLIAGKII